MPDKDALSDLRKAKEEEYFHNKERALLEKLRQRAAAEREARELGEVLRIKDERILRGFAGARIHCGYHKDPVCRPSDCG